MNPEALPQGDDKTRAIRSMFDTIAPRYERVNRILTFGLDIRWRRRSLTLMGLEPGSTVLDLACGTGDFCRLLSSNGHHPVGVDLSFGMLVNARTDAPLVQADVFRLPFADASVDGVTCGFGLRNFVALEGFFAEVARVTKPGGKVAFLDAYIPSSLPLRIGHGFYFGKVVPIVGGILGGSRRAYAYLPKSVDYMPEPEVVIRQILDAGFHNVSRRLFVGGAAHLFTAAR